MGVSKNKGPSVYERAFENRVVTFYSGRTKKEITKTVIS